MRNFLEYTCYFRIFKLALQRAAVDGSKAVHIGDNYVSTYFFSLRPGTMLYMSCITDA